MAEDLEPATVGTSECYRRRNGGLFLVDCSYTPHRMPVHRHAGVNLYFVLRGEVTEVHRREHYVLQPTALCYLPPLEPHANDFHRGARLLEIFPEDAWLEHIQAYCTLPADPRPICNDELTRLAARLQREFRAKDTAAPLAIEGMILEILAAICREHKSGTRSPTRRPRWLDQAVDLLHARFRENLSLDEVSVAVGIHQAHLSRMFRRHYGCSIGDYLRKLRIDQARHELLTSDMPLAEIAITAGYSDQSHFTVAFKRHTGVTPGEFRRSMNPRAPRDKTHR